MNVKRMAYPDDMLISEYADLYDGDFTSIDNDFISSGYTIKEFEDFISKKQFEKENVYGSHSSQKDIIMCRFFSSKDNESILSDIEKKNIEQGMGNISIPNTNIKLINYSICPKCQKIFSYKELIDYYRNPMPDPEFKNKGYQVREDTRVCCSECREYFLPALVIADGTPKNEVQFLCKMQTVEAIEKYFLLKGEKVLSKNRKNIKFVGKFVVIKNDVKLKRLEPKPSLITNLIQYTPFNLISNLIDGTNNEKGDILFGKWNPIRL